MVDACLAVQPAQLDDHAIALAREVDQAALDVLHPDPEVAERLDRAAIRASAANSARRADCSRGAGWAPPLAAARAANPATSGAQARAAAAASRMATTSGSTRGRSALASSRVNRCFGLGHSGRVFPQRVRSTAR